MVRVWLFSVIKVLRYTRRMAKKDGQQAGDGKLKGKTDSRAATFLVRFSASGTKVILSWED